MNSPLIDNAARFPVLVMQNLEKQPSMLRDESNFVLIKVCKILAREGLRIRVLALCENLDSGRKALVRQAIQPHQHATH